jgi:hypothetical protein
LVADLQYETGVSYRGTVKNGVVVLPPEVKLPDGTQVEVIAETELLPEDDPFIAAVLKLAKPRPHWPKDYALNHAHYVKGHPRKS